MNQYEQDWLELGFRFAKAIHFQSRWAARYAEARQAEEARDK